MSKNEQFYELAQKFGKDYKPFYEELSQTYEDGDPKLYDILVEEYVKAKSKSDFCIWLSDFLFTKGLKKKLYMEKLCKRTDQTEEEIEKRIETDANNDVMNFLNSLEK